MSSESADLDGRLGVAVGLLTKCLGPLRVSADTIESEDGAEAIEKLIVEVHMFCTEAINSAARSTPEESAGEAAPVAWQERTYWDEGEDAPKWGAWYQCQKPSDEQLRREKNLGIKREYRPVYTRPAAQPAPVGSATDDIKRAREILARLCEEGLVRMSIPVRQDDEDMVLSRVIALAAAPAPASADKCATCNDAGIVGHAPDDYFNCPDCTPAPSEAVKDKRVSVLDVPAYANERIEAERSEASTEACRALVEYDTKTDRDGNGIEQAYEKAVALARAAIGEAAQAELRGACKGTGKGVSTAEPTQAFDAFLCRAWGETDLTCAELVTDWEGVRRFMVREWLGEEGATDFDGENTLDRVKADFDEHEDDQRGGAFTLEFEIGGVSIERVCAFAAPSHPPATPAWVTLADAIAERFVSHPDNRLDLCNAVLDAMRLAATPAVAVQAEPDGEVYSAHHEYATVRWKKPKGDPGNAWSWPTSGEKIYLAAHPKPAAPATADEASDVNAALEAVDVLYDLTLQQSTSTQRIDAKIALKRAILALRSGASDLGRTAPVAPTGGAT